jgi:hypothetical protein
LVVLFHGSLLTVALAVASVDGREVRALPRWSASPNEAESGRPDVVWPAILKVHWEHRFEWFVGQQGLWWLCEFVWTSEVMAEHDEGLENWFVFSALWNGERRSSWCVPDWQWWTILGSLRLLCLQVTSVELVDYLVGQCAALLRQLLVQGLGAPAHWSLWEGLVELLLWWAATGLLPSPIWLMEVFVEVWRRLLAV